MGDGVYVEVNSAAQMEHVRCSSSRTERSTGTGATRSSCISRPQRVASSPHSGRPTNPHAMAPEPTTAEFLHNTALAVQHVVVGQSPALDGRLAQAAPHLRLLPPHERVVVAVAAGVRPQHDGD